MSSNGESVGETERSSELNPPSHHVEDEEGFADTERKRHVLQLRQDVDEWKGRLRNRVAFEELTQYKAITLWHGKVRTFLVSIEPLLRNDNLEENRDYYEDVKLGSVTLAPPEEYRKQSSIPTTEELRKRDFELLEDVPEPKVKTIRGLKAVIENESITATWDLTVNNQAGPGLRTKTITEERPFTWQILLNAVRESDQFLQNIGIGFEVVESDTRDGYFTYDDILEHGPPADSAIDNGDGDSE